MIHEVQASELYVLKPTPAMLFLALRLRNGEVKITKRTKRWTNNLTGIESEFDYYEWIDAECEEWMKPYDDLEQLALDHYDIRYPADGIMLMDLLGFQLSAEQAALLQQLYVTLQLSGDQVAKRSYVLGYIECAVQTGIINAEEAQTADFKTATEMLILLLKNDLRSNHSLMPVA